MISTSNPSSNSRFRSALRLISGFDIEHHAVHDLYRMACRQRAIWVIMRSLVIRDGEAGIGSGRQRQIRDCDKLLIADLVFGPDFLTPVDDDLHFMWLVVLQLFDCLFEMSFGAHLKLPGFGQLMLCFAHLFKRVCAASCALLAVFHIGVLSQKSRIRILSSSYSNVA